VLSEETIQKMMEMKLMTMATTMRELLASPPSQELSWEERIGMLIDREWTDRENRRVARRIKEARLGLRASLEDVACDPARGLALRLREFNHQQREEADGAAPSVDLVVGLRVLATHLGPPWTLVADLAHVLLMKRTG